MGASTRGRRRAGAACVAAVLWAGAAAAVAPPLSFGDGMCAVRTRDCAPEPRLAVLSAFPGELRPLLERATVVETVVVGDRVLRVGTLEGVPVVLGLLGIGMVNAAGATNLVLDRFPVEAIVVSGVAGAPYRIADVTVPATWMDDTCASFQADPRLLDLAAAVAATLPPFEHCTPVPPEPPGPEVCLAYEPTMVVGGLGLSSDPFGGQAAACQPARDAVFACDVEPRPEAARARAACDVGTGTFVDIGTEDMETGAVAREATRRGVPFVAFRALSDGDGDPLNLPGFPSQFFAYYQVAARNAASAAAALVARWGSAAPVTAAPASGSVAARSSCRWERRASAQCEGGRASRALVRQVDRACRLLATDTPSEQAVDRAWCRTAKTLRRRAARRRLGTACAGELAETLHERGCARSRE